MVSPSAVLCSSGDTTFTNEELKFMDDVFKRYHNVKNDFERGCREGSYSKLSKLNNNDNVKNSMTTQTNMV